MRRLALLSAIFLAAAMLPAQNPAEQRYPSMPGIPGLNRGKKQPKKDAKDAQPTHALTGTLRRIDSGLITITADDTRNITAKRSATTKFLNKGQVLPADSLKPGARIHMDATQDDEGYFYAVVVSLEREGTERERAIASDPVQVSMRLPGEADKEERPVIRRGDTADEPGKEAENTTPERVRPMTDKPLDESDPGRPRQQRGKRDGPAAASNAPEKKTGEWKAAPSYSAETAGNPAGKDPAEAIDPLVGKARKAVSAYTTSLPNYYCQQLTARFVSTVRPANWRAQDVLSAALIFENGKERYTGLTINGKPAKKDMEQLSGSWSTGEFGTVIADLFSPSTDARFRQVRATSISGRDAILYDFDVELENSHWQINLPGQFFKPAYKGSVWLDRETAQVLRIEMQAFRMPKEFPLSAVESAVDYQFLRLGDRQFLLPIHAENLTCIRGTSDCSRNVIDFRNYHKFEGQSTITFDD